MPVQYEDYVGLELNMPQPIQLFGIWNQNPSEKLKIDYKLDGFANDNTSWFLYKDTTDIIYRYNSHRTEYGYNIMCNEKFH